MTRWTLIAVAAALGCAAGSPAAHAQASAFAGHWRWNKALSTLPPGETAPADLTTEIARVDSLHVQWTITRRQADGQQPEVESFDAPANGEFYPISADTTAAFRMVGAALQATFKDSTGATDTLSCTLSADHARMTCNGAVSQPGGGVAHYVDVFDRT